MIRCLRCFEEYPDIYEVCPVCGNSVGCLSAPEGWLKPGCQLDGRYIIGTGAGRGGFGYVYRAYDRLTGDITAIKELFLPSLMKRSDDGISVEPLPSRTPGKGKNGGALSSLKRQFRHEASSAAGASAFGGCDVIDYFEENGTAYLAMEYIGGRTLAGMISDCDTGLCDKINLMLAVIKAVGDMHSAGTVHLDIAPDNIIVSEGEGGRTVHLIDFGSSIRDRDYHPVRDKIFKAGYSSPELTCGSLDGADRIRKAILCDIYSLGATAYVLLTGTAPVRAESRLQKKETMPSPAELDERIPQAVSDCIMKALELSPGKRYPGTYDFYSSMISAAAGSGIEGIIPIRPEDDFERVRYGRNSPFAVINDEGKEAELKDRTLITGVCRPVPEQLLPGTELKRKYTVAQKYRREGACLVYEVEDKTLGRTVEICEFFPKKLCRRGADGTSVEPLSDGFSDAAALFAVLASKYAAFSEYPGGDGITDIFRENNTVYLRRRCGRPMALSFEKDRKRKSGFEEAATAMKAAVLYLNALNSAGLSHGNVNALTLRQSDDGRISVFSPAELFWPKSCFGFGNHERGYTAPEKCVASSGINRGRAAAENLQAADAYGIGALLFRATEGMVPPDAAFRIECLARGGQDPMPDACRRLKGEDRCIVEKLADPNPLKRKEGMERLLRRL